MTAPYHVWLNSALAVKPGGRHPDLGKYRTQDFGCAFNRPKFSKCQLCGAKLVRDKHDPCMRNLPGVFNACCGHGGWRPPYATLKSGFCLQGKALKVYLEKVGRWRKLAALWNRILPLKCRRRGPPIIIV